MVEVTTKIFFFFLTDHNRQNNLGSIQGFGGFNDCKQVDIFVIILYTQLLFLGFKLATCVIRVTLNGTLKYLLCSSVDDRTLDHTDMLTSPRMIRVRVFTRVCLSACMHVVITFICMHSCVYAVYT